MVKRRGERASIVAMAMSGKARVKQPQPKSLAAFCRLPLRVVGIPVALANFLLALVTPIARFQEKDRPGIPVLLLRLFLPIVCLLNTTVSAVLVMVLDIPDGDAANVAFTYQLFDLGDDLPAANSKLLCPNSLLTHASSPLL